MYQNSSPLSRSTKDTVATRSARNGLALRICYAVAVLGPLVATGGAIVELWQRTVAGVDLALLGVMYFAIAMGVTIGFHRYLTHRGFWAPAWLKLLLLVFGSMALEGPATAWASTHLEHHARSDREGDPHSPTEGFFHAHVGWIIDGFRANTTKYATWLQDDPIVRFVDRTFWLWVALSLVIPFAVDGWRGLLWGGLVRIFLVHHVTWSVNSVCHTFGRRPFRTGDRSTNHWLVGLLAGGEGWHNNHHAFQRSAFHGLFWWQFDLSGLLILGMERLHFISDVQRVSREILLKRLHNTRAPGQRDLQDVDVASSTTVASVEARGFSLP